jgi:hypothetical protein
MVDGMIVSNRTRLRIAYLAVLLSLLILVAARLSGGY